MKKLIFAFCLILMPSISHAEEASWWDTWKSNAGKTWASDKYEVMLPLYTYHIRASYHRDSIAKYNEIPVGLGIDKYYFDEDGNKHYFHAIVFADSFYRPQPMAGYGFQKNWYLNEDKDMALGAGITAVLTARGNSGYVPFPGVIPGIAFEYKRATFQLAWVPYMGFNNGNILFALMQWKI